MSQLFDVYGMGNAIVDLQVEAPDADLAALGIEKGSFRLVDEKLRDRIMSHYQKGSVRRSSGGSAANTIIALSQLGAKTAYAGIVGDDKEGDFYRKEMEDLGVVFHNGPRAGMKTGTSFILVSPDAERTMNTHLGATATFGPADVREDLLARSAWLFIEGYLLSSETGLQAARRASSVAREAGVKIALTCSDAMIIEHFRDAVEEQISRSDLVFANVKETAMLTRRDDEEEAFRELKELAPNIVMTRSEHGAWIWLDKKESRVPAYTVRAIDATGAGDMFAGAFLHGIVHKMDGVMAGKLACFLSSRVVAQIGARLSGDIRALSRMEGM